MRRILATDPEFNPGWKELGVWNFFKLLPAARTDWGVSLDTVNRTDAFEWKTGGRGPGFRAVLYNYLYEIAATAWGGIWFDEWKPGFSGKKEHMERGHVAGTALSVREDETVTVTAGTFPDCRHVTAEVRCVHDYWSGHLEFWYAPGVGLVKFLRLGTAEDEAEENAEVKLHGSKTGYWIHNSIVGFGVAGKQDDALYAKPSKKARMIKVSPGEGLYFHPLEVRGNWVKVVSIDGRYTGWMLIDRICSNSLTTCP